MSPEPRDLARRLRRGLVVELPDAARRLRVSVRQVQRYLAAGALPCERYRRPDGRQRVVIPALALLAGPLRTRRGLWRRKRRRRPA